MIVLPKEIKKDILALKKLAKKHRKAEDKEFQAICSWLKIDPEGMESDDIFDYIHNDIGWSIEFK
jgi:hypothetical protein